MRPRFVLVHYTVGGSADDNGVDYDGMTKGPASVTIPLVNGSGGTSLRYTEKDDALDEGDETVTVTPTGATVSHGTAEFSSSTVTSTIVDNDQWRVGGPITGTITTSRGDNPVISINSTLGLTLNAFDSDENNASGYWGFVMDDVTSGTTEADYHVKWTASAGTFVNPYGTDVTYLAPDAAGTLVREVTITAMIDDFNRGADVFGFNDAAVQVQAEADVWEIKLTVQQDGQTSGNYDGPAMLARAGSNDLGWVEPNQPPNATGYKGNTQVTGTLPAPAPVSGYTWKQEFNGLSRRKENGGDWIDDENNNTNGQWKADGANTFVDTDARHGDVTGIDVREIFFLDSPGITFNPAGAETTPPAGWTTFQWSFRYKTWVSWGGVKFSNEAEWYVSYRLDAVNNAWVVARHTP